MQYYKVRVRIQQLILKLFLVLLLTIFQDRKKVNIWLAYSQSVDVLLWNTENLAE